MAVAVNMPRPHRPLRWVLAALALVALVPAGAWLGRADVLPVTTIRITGDAPHVDVERLKARLAAAIDGNFLTFDARRVSRAAEALPWVAGASVRRVWPDTVEVVLRERVPLARWGDGALMDEEGVVFRPGRLPPDVDRLPRLAGPAGSEQTVLETYRRLNGHLAPLGLALVALEQNARRAWRARLDNGIRLQLGRGTPDARLQRLAAVYPRILAPEAARIDSIDLRYPNGLAVRWKDIDTGTHG